MRIARAAAVAAWIILAFFDAPYAEARPDTLQMTCQQTASLINQAGSVVLGTGPNIYDRYVSSRYSCGRPTRLDPIWLPTKDVSQCFIGYSCRVR
jgi:hypothetical protein